MPDRGLFTQTGDNMRGKFKLAKNQTQFQIKLPRPAQDSPDSLSKRGEDDAYTYMIIEPDGILIRPKKHRRLRIKTGSNILKGRHNFRELDNEFEIMIPFKASLPPDAPSSVLPFNPFLYQRLPDVLDANADFNAVNGREKLASVFFPLLCKHSLEDKLGFCLVHQHVKLAPDQNWVLHGPVANLLPNIDDPAAETPELYPIAWMYRDEGGKFMAVEHSSPALDDQNPPFDLSLSTHRPFLKDLSIELVKANLYNTVGIVVRPSGGIQAERKVYCGPKDAATEANGSVPSQWFADTNGNEDLETNDGCKVTECIYNEKVLDALLHVQEDGELCEMGVPEGSAIPPSSCCTTTGSTTEPR